MKIEIKFLRFERHHNRTIAYAQGVNHNTHQVVVDGSLATIMSWVNDQPDTQIVNAQEILDNIIRINGFAS